MGQYSAVSPDPDNPNAHCNYGGVNSPGSPPFTRTLTLNDANAFMVPAQGPHAWLIFWSYEITEKTGAPDDTTDTCRFTPSCDKDIRRVYIKEVSATEWGDPVWSTLEDAAIESVWHHVALNVDPWRGQMVQIRFEFTTGEDAYLNQFPGWYIDQIAVFDTSVEVYLPVVAR